MKRPSPRIAVLWTCAAILLLTGAWASLGAEPASVAPVSAVQASAQISVSAANQTQSPVGITG